MNWAVMKCLAFVAVLYVTGFAVEAAPSKTDLDSSNIIIERLARAVASKPTTRGPTKPQSTAKLPAKLVAKSNKPVSSAKAAVVVTKKSQISSPKNVAAAVTAKKSLPTSATATKAVTIAKQALSAVKKVQPIQPQKIVAPQAKVASKPIAPKVVSPKPEARVQSARQEASKSLIEVYSQFLDPKVADELNLKEANSLQEVLKALPSAVAKHHSEVDQTALSKAVEMIVKPSGFSMQELPDLINAYQESGASAAVDVQGISAAHASMGDVAETLKQAGVNILN